MEPKQPNSGWEARVEHCPVGWDLPPDRPVYVKPPFRFIGRTVICIAHEVEECAPCLDAERERSAKLHAYEQRVVRMGQVDHWLGSIRASHGDDNRADGLGGLRVQDFADFKNEAYIRRANPTVIAGWREWDLRSPIAIVAGTGDGKTSGCDAKLKEVWGAMRQAAQSGPVQFPPKIAYCTGYELSEAAKRRRLGEEPHKLTRFAMAAPVLVLDEVHSLHTSLPELFAVLDVRDRASLPTAFVSGMTLAELGAWMGAAALRRVLSGKVIDGFANAKKAVRAVR